MAEESELKAPDRLREPGTRRAPMLRVQIVQLVREGSSPFVRRKLCSSSDVYVAFRDLCAAADRESFWTILLDTKHCIIGIEEAAKGSLTCTVVHPREIYKSVLLTNAAAVIFVHNHPSGDPTPSREDLEITRRLREVGELLGVRVLDHIVVGHGKYVSMVDDEYW